MNPAQLSKMVNDIAAFFASESGEEQAVIDVAGHMQRFWDPRMRREIVAHYARGGEGLSELSMKAVAVLARASQ